MYKSIDSKIIKHIKISESYRKHVKRLIEHSAFVEIQRNLENHEKQNNYLQHFLQSRTRDFDPRSQIFDEQERKQNQQQIKQNINTIRTNIK